MTVHIPAKVARKELSYRKRKPLGLVEMDPTHPYADQVRACIMYSKAGMMDIKQHKFQVHDKGSSTGGFSEGGAMRNYSHIGENSHYVGTINDMAGFGDMTILMIKKKTDTTNRNSYTFCPNVGITTSATRAHCPWSDGVAYFDYGGSSGDKRVSIGGLDHQGVISYGFSATKYGLSIHMDGKMVADNSVAASRSTGTAQFNVNGYGLGGDNIDVYFFLIVGGDPTKSEVSKWTQDPYQFIRSKHSPIMLGEPTLSLPPVPVKIPRKKAFKQYAYPNRQPSGGVGVDKKHWFGRSVKASYILRGGEVITDLVTGKKAYWNITFGPPGRQNRGKGQGGGRGNGNSGQGLGGNHSGASDNTYRYNLERQDLRDLMDGQVRSPNPFTILAEVNPDAAGGYDNNAMFSVNGADDFLIWCGITASRTTEVFWRDVHASGEVSHDLGAKGWYWLAYSTDGIDDNRLYINGKQVAQYTSSTSSSGTFSDGPYIGGWPGNASDYYRGGIASLTIADRFINEGQAKALMHNPFQYLESKQGRGAQVEQPGQEPPVRSFLGKWVGQYIMKFTGMVINKINGVE